MGERYMRDYAERWVAAWNARDLDAIMEHYASNVRFRAPTVVARWGGTDGVLEGTDALRRHFARGLELAPNLHFALLDVLFGLEGMTILYRRETGQLVADVVVLDTAYRAVDVRAFYGALSA